MFSPLMPAHGRALPSIYLLCLTRTMGTLINSLEATTDKQKESQI